MDDGGTDMVDYCVRSMLNLININPTTLSEDDESKLKDIENDLRKEVDDQLRDTQTTLGKTFYNVIIHAIINMTKLIAMRQFCC